MSEPPGPSKLTIVWSQEARSDLRAIEREIALAILHCVDRYLRTRSGDVKKLRHPEVGFRLRCGDYRIFFEQPRENAISVTGVKNRRDAYR